MTAAFNADASGAVTTFGGGEDMTPTPAQATHMQLGRMSPGYTQWSTDPCGNPISRLSAIGQDIMNTVVSGVTGAVALGAIFGTDGGLTPEAGAVVASSALSVVSNVGGIITLAACNGNRVTGPAAPSTSLPGEPIEYPPTTLPPSPPGTWPSPPSTVDVSSTSIDDIVYAVFHTQEGTFNLELADFLNRSWIQCAAQAYMNGGGANPKFEIVDLLYGSGTEPDAVLVYEPDSLDVDQTLQWNLENQNAGHTFSASGDGYWQTTAADGYIYKCMVSDADFKRDCWAVAGTAAQWGHLGGQIMDGFSPPTGWWVEAFFGNLMNQFWTTLHNAYGHTPQEVWEEVENRWKLEDSPTSNPSRKYYGAIPRDFGSNDTPNNQLIYEVSALDPTLSLHDNLVAMNPGLTFTVNNQGLYQCNTPDGLEYVCLVSQADFDRDVHYLYTPSSGPPQRSVDGDLNQLFALIPIVFS